MIAVANLSLKPMAAVRPHDERRDPGESHDGNALAEPGLRPLDAQTTCAGLTFSAKAIT